MSTFRKTWWIFALQGLFLIALGALAIFVADFTLITLIPLFGLILLVFGAILVFAGYKSKIAKARKAMLITFGALELIAGIAIVAYPTDASRIFTYIIGGWAVLMGLAQYVMALRNKNGKLYLVNGSISTAFGLLIIYNPFKDPRALTYIVGFYSLILGIFVIYYSFKLKKLGKVNSTSIDSNIQENQDAPSTFPEQGSSVK